MHALLWVLHHLILFALVGGAIALAALFPVLFAKFRTPIVAVLLIALCGQWFYDMGIAAEGKQTDKARKEVVYQKQIVTQQVVTQKVVDHYIDRIKVVHEKGATIVREVTRYVPADSCSLPAGFGVLHDAAAQGVSLPDGASVPVGPAIPAQVVAATVADNYTTCHATEAQLIALQEWVREQQKAAH